MHHPKDYRGAVERLNSFQSNLQAINEARTNKDPSDREKRRLNMIENLRTLGVDIEKLANKTIHVAGTKGKGSTCAMTESIIRHHQFSTGLFTSPHLVVVRERIKINGKSISEELFSKYFWECHDLLKIDTNPQNIPYFQFLTVMAMKVFHEERVDCVVMEVGIGGRFDSTNFLQSAVACGITTLDYDHTQILGETLAKIAYEKAGIMKRGVPVIVTPQVDEAQDVIVSTAVEVGARLFLAAPLASYGHEAATLGLQALYQELNAALAIALAHTWLSSKTQSEDQISLFTGNGCTSVSQKNLDQQFPTFPLSPAYVTGFMNTKWPGRAQVLRMQDGYPNVTFYIDGAHTIQSIKQCLLWFQANEQFTHAVRILCFNCKPDKDIGSSGINAEYGDKE
eukprot:TRINITY_DN10359_c0_g1_i8.p1 TRINITY_DN10359_c0_g1~~TRINITY_DN10359_c0_g1_i8.p1  ORF type:complete len:396 (+),score=80.01 TRINITY_DN10359_c0_g1_i8:76-1263(+)